MNECIKGRGAVYPCFIFNDSRGTRSGLSSPLAWLDLLFGSYFIPSFQGFFESLLPFSCFLLLWKRWGVVILFSFPGGNCCGLECSWWWRESTEGPGGVNGLGEIDLVGALTLKRISSSCVLCSLTCMLTYWSCVCRNEINFGVV